MDNNTDIKTKELTYLAAVAQAYFELFQLPNPEEFSEAIINNISAHMLEKMERRLLVANLIGFK